MKCWIVGIAIAVLGFGGYASVELILLSPRQRAQWINGLPIVRSLNKVASMQSFENVRVRAEEGDPSAMMEVYRIGQYWNRDGDMERAIELLKEHESATAKVYLNFWIQKTVDPYSREGLLLTVQSKLENFRRPFQDDDAYRKQTKRLQNSLTTFYQFAEDGDEDAQWVVEQLALN